MFWRYVDKVTALIKFANDPLLAADSGQSAALIPLELSAASDTVEHAVLIDWLKFWAGIINTPFNWLRAYLSHKTLSTDLKNLP